MGLNTGEHVSRGVIRRLTNRIAPLSTPLQGWNPLFPEASTGNRYLDVAMYTIDRTDAPGKASERTTAPLQPVEQTLIAPAAIVRAGSTEPGEIHDHQKCDPNLGAPSPPSQLPLDNARPVSGHHEQDNTGGIVDPSEPNETRAFLDEDRSNDGSSHDTKTRIKVSRAKLLAAW
jgi:hypothetical protein